MLQGGVQVGSLLTCIHHSQPSGANPLAKSLLNLTALLDHQDGEHDGGQDLGADKGEGDVEGLQTVQEEEGGGVDAQADGEGVVVVEEAAEGVECR